MSNKIKLTPALLKKLVMEEKRKLMETLEQGKEDSEKVKAEEADADELADTLEKDIDFMAALKIQESMLKKKYAKVQAAKKRILKKINERKN
jgi:RNA polymerase-binding transcription factor DksA